MSEVKTLQNIIHLDSAKEYLFILDEKLGFEEKEAQALADILKKRGIRTQIIMFNNLEGVRVIEQEKKV